MADRLIAGRIDPLSFCLPITVKETAMSIHFVSFERDRALEDSPVEPLHAQIPRPGSAAAPRFEAFDADRIGRAGEDISSLLLLIPVALLALVSFGAMLTPL
ncbi:hypothetical protein [Sphingopyxis sp. 113P3]|uniref:hypothetical protein n=1 Tax=Sphingopyxis sp. (strain 113P3) TaxID=292913 RepID=UPI0006BE013C|nr:hypothetical protein [Sphingopyxis sp. 113P3]ALC13361.1 hypothetical protein LH20_15495 [Sphingopyxis sp. 113P3]